MIKYIWQNQQTQIYYIYTVNSNGQLINYTLTKDEFSKYIKSENTIKVINTIPPKINKVQIMVTDKCNFNCKHCYLNKKYNKDINIKKLKILISQLIKKGLRIVEISGGEPFLYPYFDELLNYLKKRELFIIVLSNGSFQQNIKNEKLLAKIDLIQISMDRWSQDLDLFRQYKNAFKIIISNIFYLLKINKKINITSVICKDTSFFDIYLINEFTKKYNIRHIIAPIVPVGKAENISKCELLKIYNKICAFNKIFKTILPIKYNCTAGESFIYIDNNLQLKPCPLLYTVTIATWLKIKTQYKDCSLCCDPCLFSCPAYRFYFNKNQNIWCKINKNINNGFFDTKFGLEFIDIPKTRTEEAKGIVNILPKNIKKIVSFGGGRGDVESEIQKLENYDITIIDNSNQMINAGRKKYKLLKFICADLKKLKQIKLKNKFDAVISIWSSVLGYESGNNDNLFFENAARVLKPNGIFILDFNNLKVLKQNIKRKIETQEILVNDKKFILRHIFREPDKFVTFLDVYKKDKLVYSDVWELKHYYHDEIVTLAKKYGFSLIHSYGSLQKLNTFEESKNWRQVLVFKKSI